MVCHQLHVDDSLTAVCWMETDLLQEIGMNSAPFTLNDDNLQELAVICVEKENGCDFRFDLPWFTLMLGFKYNYLYAPLQQD